MKMKYQNIFKPLDIFLMNDQPFSCPHCGSRCDELASFHHTKSKTFIQKCLNDQCCFVCLEEEDEYFLKLWE